MNINHKLGGVLAMVGTASLWSMGGLLIKLIDWQPFLIAGMRSFIASLVILAFIRKPVFHFSFAQIAAALSYAVTMILFVIANKTTTAANAVLLQYIAPVLTAFIAAGILKERTRIEHWGAIIFVAAGMFIMFMDELGTGQMLGNFLALCSAFTFSLYFVFLRMQKEGSPFESNILAHWITAAVCFTVSLFLPAPVLSTSSVTAMLVLGAVQMGIPSILIAIGIRRISAVSAILIAVIEPVFNPVWVFLIIGEFPGWNTVIGGAVIVFAVTAVSLISAKRSMR
jgi:drug/metabolite transporter (DMT)-like permease